MSPITGVSKYAYGNDSRGRRAYVVRTGGAFAQGHQDAWGYDDRDELTAARRYNNTTPESTQSPDTSLDRVYAYDPIGNRMLSRDGTDPNTVYTANSLNPYDPVTKATTPESAQRLSYDEDGNLVDAYLAGDVDGDGNVNQQDYGALLAAYGKCEGDPLYYAGANLSDATMCGSDPNLAVIDQSDLGVLLTYYGVSATNSIRANLTWDAENRLVVWEPAGIVDGAKKVEFKYDYQGRRIEKKVYNYDGESWNLSQTRRFVWNDWLVVLELDGDNAVQRKLTWGLDLAGQHGVGPVSDRSSLESAGGIGGLLATSDPNDLNDPNDLYGDFVFCYDANGNVGQLIDLAAQGGGTAIKAHYEYDPYGNVIVQSGAYAAANPYRFSTKPWDDETGLGYWGYRHYDPRLGRWINRDPIEERGGEHLYSYARNEPASLFDGVGLYCFSFACGAGEPQAPPVPNPCPILDNPLAPCRLNPMCWCTFLYGPPARDTVWGFDQNLMCVSVFSPWPKGPPKPWSPRRWGKRNPLDQPGQRDLSDCLGECAEHIARKPRTGRYQGLSAAAAAVMCAKCCEDANTLAEMDACFK